MALPEFLQEEHRRFAFTADEWLIAYAQLNATMIAVYPMTFSMAMVLELYLKSYAAFLSGNGVDVTSFSHRMADLYEHLQSADPEFPSELKLDVALSKLPLHDLDSENWQCDWYLRRSESEREDIKKNYEIYLAMQYAVDLKYGISPALARHNGRIISSAWGRLNPWLAKFVVGVRRRTGKPSNPADDRLYWALRQTDLHPDARQYLEAIHGQ